MPDSLAFTHSLVLFIGIIIGNVTKKDPSYNENTTIKKNKGTFKNALSMMLETGSNTDTYELTTANEWPTSGYKFNSKLSKCENGGSVSWDYQNKNVVMEGTSSDKCFIYFDKIVTVNEYCSAGTNLADCIKTYGNAGYDTSSIYIHDSSLKNGAGDNSYRFAGESDYVNNYVCFGSDADVCPTDNLYRIIGVFGDQVKLIKADYATSELLGKDGDYYGVFTPSVNGLYKGSYTISSIGSYYWNYKSDTSINDGRGSNNWSTSLLNTINLNGNYLSYLGTTWANMIDKYSWQVNRNGWGKLTNVPAYQVYQNEIVNPAVSITVTTKVGLMYISDYGYAVNQNYWDYNILAQNKNDYRIVRNENWLYMGLDEWVITSNSAPTNSDTWLLRAEGYLSNFTIRDEDCLVRPTFYLKNSINYNGGSGTKDSPIRIA